MIEQKDLPDFLQQQGYQLDDLAGTEQLKQRYLENIDHGVLHEGEYLVLSTAGDRVSTVVDSASGSDK